MRKPEQTTITLTPAELEIVTEALCFLETHCKRLCEEHDNTPAKPARRHLHRARLDMTTALVDKVRKA